MTVRVSVVVPVYNCGARFWPTLESLRAQTMPRSDFEVILVDDGSTDTTVQSLRGDTAFDRWIRVVASEHSGGPGRPRNIGVDEAVGEFVLFLDGDDRLAPEALERLYAQAVRADADIVVPRTAGHGRPVPRDATALPLERGHLLTHPALVQSMTALKLFRRSFLLRQGLRFPEGRVPLEDHLFTLRAHLAAGSVSVVHDYTCYHAVRRSDPGPPPHAGTGIADVCRSVAALFGLVRQGVAPGPQQDALIAHWYQEQLLGRLDERVLGQSAAGYAKTHRAILDLVQREVPPQVDAHLPATLRVRSAVLRSGSAEDLRVLARHEAGFTHHTRVEALGWNAGRFSVMTSSDLLHQGKDGTVRPVRFVVDGDRLRWDLPAGLLALPGVAEAADMTEALAATALRGYARLRDDNTDVYLPGHHRLVSIPLGRNADGLPTVSVRVEATTEFDAARADHDRPVTGLWDFNILIETCGWRRPRRIGDNRSPVADGQLRPAFLADATLVAPYWTKTGNLSVRVAPAAPGALKQAVREPDRSAVWADGPALRVRIPVELAPLERPVAVEVTLAAEPGRTLAVPGRIAPGEAADLAVLEFSAPVGALGPDGPAAGAAAAPGACAWEIHLRQDGAGKSAALGLTLGQAGPGSWSVAGARP
ncbi:glycosyltransferase family A protein [Kitasatospora paranensis]|uniref:Glycosyltransferase family A protein n=1 Tax=Kitasatospora paranensis TaxID=258053 RepID=A0ABW2FVZ8_9ACTN